MLTDDSSLNTGALPSPLQQQIVTSPSRNYLLPLSQREEPAQIFAELN